MVGAYLALSTARCTFPEYDIYDPAAGGVAGGTTGAGATVGVAGATAVGGSRPAAGAAGAGDAGEGGGGSVLPPECRAEQWPIDRCESDGACVPYYPDHCYDGEATGDEVDADCGGSCQRCTRELCKSGDDCLSGSCAAGDPNGTCYAPISISFTAHEQNISVGSITWSITLTNNEPEDGAAYTLKDLKLRYYFDRTGVVEPILVRATQSNMRLLNGENRGLSKTVWAIERVEDVPDVVYDAYVEVGFGDTGQFFPGDKIDLYQQMVTGDSGASPFDQRANYSFTEDPASPWLHVTVFYRNQLVWGLEPRPANPRACFARGVNLNGPALEIAGRAWQSAAQAAVTTTGSGVSQGGPPFPVVTGTFATMLQTATRLEADHELTLPTDNGTYLAYLYATSPTNDAAASSLTVQGVQPETSGQFFSRGPQSDGKVPWARLGPYRVDVTAGELTIGVVAGVITFTGIELWYPE